jgi:hypothetical protein
MSDVMPNIPSDPTRLRIVSGPSRGDEATEEIHKRHRGLMVRGQDINYAFDNEDLLFRQIFDQALGLPPGNIHSEKVIRAEAGQLHRAIEELSVIEVSRFEMKPIRNFIRDYETKLQNLADGPGKKLPSKSKASPLAEHFVEVARRAISALYVELADIAAESEEAGFQHDTMQDMDINAPGPRPRRRIDISSGVLGVSMEQLKRIETPQLSPSDPNPRNGGGIFGRKRRFPSERGSMGIAS